MGVESGSSVSGDIRGRRMGKFHHLYENIRLRYDTETGKNGNSFSYCLYTVSADKSRTLFFRTVFRPLLLLLVTFLIAYLVALVLRISNWSETCL